MQIMNSFGGGRWVPSIGDPTFLGWFTVAAYFASAALCAIYARRLDPSTCPRRLRRNRVLWWGLASALVLLGLNKQLDLQSLLTAIGRGLAQDEGWYRQRRSVQLWFIVITATVGVAMFSLIVFAMRRDWRRNGLALFGIAFLVGFILIRAASFHHVDAWLMRYVGAVRVNWIFEIIGIICIGTSAAINLRKLPKRKPPSRPLRDEDTR